MLREQVDLNENTIGCANCHDPRNMNLRLYSVPLTDYLTSQGKKFEDLPRNEKRAFMCGQCHVEYYFLDKEFGPAKKVTVPWAKGLYPENVYSYYENQGNCTIPGFEGNFVDWVHPVSQTPMLKAQHPEYETFTAGSTHYNAGVACADCHMPYTRDGAMKYSDHNIRSPLLNSEAACGQCHSDVDYVITRVGTIQDQVFTAKQALEDALVDAITALAIAVDNPDLDAALVEEARSLHRTAQFMWDFVSAENSMGFHNPEYSLSILVEATNLARQAQMKAAQAANDPSLLLTGIYYTLDPVPTPIPVP